MTQDKSARPVETPATLRDLQADWLDVNNRAIRNARIRTALIALAWFLALSGAGILALIIANHGMARAATMIEIAPAMLRH